MTIGLALSGGGALGGAHIGILDVLSQQDIHLDCIGGTSAGALIGLLYAAGGMEAIEGFLQELTERGVIHPNHGLVLKTVDGIFNDIRESLATQVAGRNFSELDTPFFCVATDIITGKMVVLDSGDPVAAVLASCAYPGVFPIQQVSEHFLVDGGLVCNLPSDLLRAREIDFIIGSSLYCLSPLTPVQQRGRLSRLLVAGRALEIIEKDRVFGQIAYCDFCFTPPVEIYKWFDFAMVKDLRNLGNQYAASRIGELKERIEKQEQLTLAENEERDSPKSWWERNILHKYRNNH
ncbi:MAG: patatin-like phospholipase family protein [bacterium]